VRRLVARYPIAVYFVAVMVVHIGIVASQYYEIRNHGLGMLRLYTPAIIALAVMYVGEGWEAAKGNVASLFKVNVAPKFYLFALLYPAFVGMLALSILWLVGAVPAVEVDWEAASGARFFSLSGRVSAVEEIAWIGFVLHMFSRRYKLFQASALTGLLWGIWYIPLVLAEIQVVPGLPIAPLILNFVTIGAICGWLYLRTHSAAPVFIMQVTTNYTSVTIPVLPQKGGMVAYVAFVVMKALFALALYLIWGPKPLYGRVKPGTSSLEDRTA
jgi:membrane protease YdiL (CAAX protease family)